MSTILLNHYIEVTQLRVGLYVHLDLSWMDHSFAFSNFKLKDEQQIAKIRKIGVKKLRYDPNRSDCEPLPVAPIDISADSSLNLPVLPDDSASDSQVESIIAADEMATAEGIATGNEVATATIPEQSAKPIHHVERLSQLHRAFDASEKKFLAAAQTTRQVLKQLVNQPKDATSQAETLVNCMVDCALNESEIAIHAINGNRSGDKDYAHTFNVTILAMMMARSLDMIESDARTLGMAAIFHDIGKQELPSTILLKQEALTKSEQSFYQQHSEFGARLVKQAGMSEHIASVIMQHHEHADGSGYPKQLKGEQIDPLARVIAILSGYDNLCNPQNPLHAKTPYEALAYMFAHQRAKFDGDLLRHMIKSLGIYPPGSIVQLSNGLHGIVISVNPNAPLRPYVMLHDVMLERNAPLIVDLRDEPKLSISTCLKPSQLPQDARDYLNPRKRVSYFLDSALSQNALHP